MSMTKDDSTWLNVAYVVFAIVMAYVLFRAIELTGLQTGWIERFDWYQPVSTVAAVILGALLAIWLRADSERHEYLLSAVGELRKVTWPSWEDTKRMTIVVCVVVGVFAVILGAFDLVWARVLKVLLA